MSTKPTFNNLVDPANGMLSVDPLVDPAWMDLLARAPQSMIFHQPAWLRLIRDHYGVSISAWCIVTSSVSASPITARQKMAA